jgi:hypoxanthine phosphoribosyltransferase
LNTPSLQTALADAECLFDRSTLDTVVRDMAAAIDAEIDGERAVFVTVMQGALIFAAQLALAMRSDVEFDYVHATRYRGGTEGHALEWLRRPSVDLHGRSVLLVDDILDEGHTLKAVRDECLSLGARRVLLATLCSKQHDRRVPDLASDFNGVDVPDRYVFGFGMDYHEQGRNLPAIYALGNRG